MALQALRTEPFAESSAERAARIQREAAVSQQAMDPDTQHPPSQPRAKPARKTDPDDPLHVAMPTLKELESQIRRRSVGRTIAEICADLGVTPSICDGVTWSEILEALMHFGANSEQFFATQQRRRETFQKERDNRPETWTFDWRDRQKEAIRELLGSLLGESQVAAA